MGATRLEIEKLADLGIEAGFIEAVEMVHDLESGSALFDTFLNCRWHSANFQALLGHDLDGDSEGQMSDLSFLSDLIQRSWKEKKRLVVLFDGKQFQVEPLKNKAVLLVQVRTHTQIDISMLDELNLNLCKIDSDQKVVTCNQGFANLLENDAQALIGKSLPKRGILESVDIARIVTLARGRSRKGQAIGFCVNVIQKDGTTEWFDIEVVAEHAPEQSSFLIRAKQVDDIRDAHRKVVESQNAVLYSERMAALGEMANGVAHEINNPLAIINGSAYVLQSKFQSAFQLQKDEAEACIKFLDTISSTCKRVSTVVAGLRIFASARNSNPCTAEIVDLHTVANEVQELYRERFHNSGIDFSEETCEGNLRIHTHKDHLTQALMNLLNNSLEVVRGKENPQVAIRYVVDSDLVRILVIDNGPGIPSENVSRIFEPFYSTKKHEKIGIGLGLSVAKGLIESAGGRLYLDATEKDTTFVIEIPRSK